MQNIHEQLVATTTATTANKNQQFKNNLTQLCYLSQ